MSYGSRRLIIIIVGDELWFQKADSHHCWRWATIGGVWYLCCAIYHDKRTVWCLSVSGMAASRVQPKCRCLTWECRSYGGTPTTLRTRATTVGSRSSVWHASAPRSTTRHCSALSTVPSLTSRSPMCSSCKYWEISFDAVSRGNPFLYGDVHNPQNLFPRMQGCSELYYK